MKSFTFAAALLASAAVAQPHGHQHHGRNAIKHEHEKRALVVEIATAWVTATVIIGDEGTSTLPPSVPANTGAEFFEPSFTPVPTTLVPQVAPSPAPVVEAPAPPPPQPTTPQPEPTTAAPVVQPVQQAPAAAPSSAAQAPPAQEAPASSSGGGSSSGGSSSGHNYEATGDITYYDIGQGACGYDDSAENDTGMVAAISADFWNSISTLTNSGMNSPSHPLCDKKVKLTANGKTVTVTARDKCPGCTKTSIDVSKKAFTELFGSLGVGRGQVTWSVSW